jgi:hypothetical protein
MAVTIPDKKRPEWEKIIMSNEGEYNYSNYVLQVQITKLHNEVKSNKISINEAIDSLYNLCSKYALAVQEDFKQIFKTW